MDKKLNVGMLLVMLVACATEKGALPWSGGSEGDDDGPDAVGEDWDDEMADSGTTTESEPPPEEGDCGDETVDAGEECDQGSDQGADLTDGCSADCKVVPTLAWSGDGGEGVLAFEVINDSGAVVTDAVLFIFGDASLAEELQRQEMQLLEMEDTIDAIQTDIDAELWFDKDYNSWSGDGETLFCPADAPGLSYALIVEERQGAGYNTKCWASGVYIFDEYLQDVYGGCELF